MRNQTITLPLRTKGIFTTSAGSHLPRISTSMRSPGCTPLGTRAMPMDTPMVGDMEPLVSSPSPCCMRTFICPRITPRSSRSEEHTSELQSLMRISYAVFCLKKKNIDKQQIRHQHTKNKISEQKK